MARTNLRWLNLLFLCLLATMSVAQLQPVEKAAQATQYVIGQSVLSRDARCGATAVGPHALLTASHCELPTDVLYIKDHKGRVTIVGRLRDEQDHTIYLLKGVTFDTYADIDLTDTLEQGESVFMFGSPGTWYDIFRRGYVMGREHRFTVAQTLYSFQSDHGDSGSGIFNRFGKVVAVLSRAEIDGEPTDASLFNAASFPFAFTADDLQRAKTF